MIDENEQLKSQIRYKERDMAIFTDKLTKINTEVEISEKDSKRL